MQHIKDKNDDDSNYRCKCLNYLLHTNEKFNTYPENNISKLFRSYKQISSKFKTCDRNIEHIKNEDVLGKIKKLYNLHKAMDKLENSIKYNDGYIRNNAEKFAEHYRNTTNDCPTYSSDSYCSILKEIQEYIYRRTKFEKYTEASEILKTLIPNDETFIIVSCIIILGIPFFLYILYKVTKCHVQIYSYFPQYI